MKNYAEIREKAWAAINAARQQKEQAQAADPQKETVHHVDSKEQLMQVLLSKSAMSAIPG